MQQGGDDRLGVEAELDQDACHRQRVADVRLAALALLRRVRLHGELPGSADLGQVGVGIVDQQLFFEPALGGVQGAPAVANRKRAAHPVSRWSCCDTRLRWRHRLDGHPFLSVPSVLMPKPPTRLACLIVATLVIACTTQSTATPSPTPAAAVTPAPTVTPVASASASPSPATASPSQPTATPVATATASPTPSAQGAPLSVLLGSSLSDTLEQQRTANGIPGISAEIIFPDGSTWSDADGLAQLDPPVSATPDTLYVVGSMSKTFVTALIMQLAEQGKLTIDDPLSNWLPDYPNAANITIGELLSHTSGVHDFFENGSYSPLVIHDPLRAWTPQETLDSLVGPPYFEPGTGYHYSSTNFILLGLVLEQATGKQLGALLRQRLFKPIGLDHTYFQDAAHAPAAGAAVGHSATTGADISDGTNYRPTTSEATVAWAAGAILSDVTDIATWCRTLYGGHLLQPDSLAQMENYDYSPYSDETYGLGTRTRIFDGERMFGHTGSLRGFYGAMWYYPDSDLTVVVLDNKGRIDPNPIADALAGPALPVSNQYLGR